MKFTIIAKVQSPGNPVMSIKYATGVSPVKAAAVMAQIVADFAEPSTDGFPESLEPVFLGIDVQVDPKCSEL